MRMIDCVIGSFFVFPNLPNDVWFGSIDKPDACELVCSCPSDGRIKAKAVADLLNAARPLPNIRDEQRDGRSHTNHGRAT